MLYRLEQMPALVVNNRDDIAGTGTKDIIKD